MLMISSLVTAFQLTNMNLLFVDVDWKAKGKNGKAIGTVAELCFMIMLLEDSSTTIRSLSRPPKRSTPFVPSSEKLLCVVWISRKFVLTMVCSRLRPFESLVMGDIFRRRFDRVDAQVPLEVVC